MTKSKLLKHILIPFIIISTSQVLAESPTIIPDVKLQSKKDTPQKSNTSMATTQLTKTEIIKSPVADLSQLLKQEQSVVRLTNTSGDSSQTALSLRGFGDNASANSLIMVDGFPLTNPSLLAPNFNSIPLSDIERIEIYQGSSGSLWGDQAVGGVVNIISKHPKKFLLNAIMSAGNFNTYYDNLLIGNKAKNGFFYKIFGLVGKTDNFRHHNQQNANNIAVQIGFDYARGTIVLNAQSYGGLNYSPGGLSETQFTEDPRQATEFKNYSRYRTNLFQLLSKHELSNQWLLETRIDHHRTDGRGLFHWNFDRNDSLTSINPRLIGSLYKNKLIFGYYGQWGDYQFANTKADATGSARQNALYFQNSFPITNKVDFILGARKAWQVNKFESKKSLGNEPDQIFVTEEGIVYHPSEALSLFVRRDGNFRFPKANEELLLAKNIKYLQVQTGTSYEAGTKWQTEKYKSELSIYRLALMDEIAFNPVESINNPFGSFSNLDRTLRYGISVSQQYHLTSRASIKGQINYVNARFASGPFSGKLVPAVPALNGNVGLTYNWTEQWAIQYALLYTGSRYASDDVQNIGKKVPGYWLNNFAVQYLIKSFIFNLEVRNLFNQQQIGYVLYNSFRKKNVFFPGAGRNYLFTVKINID